jgi:type I restriction enzyme S subunit
VNRFFIVRSLLLGPDSKPKRYSNLGGRRYLQSSQARGQIELEATGASASMVNIAQSTIAELPIALPPRHEQEQIVEGLTFGLAQVQRLAAHARTIVTLLQEGRTALISAAVTGQIDVRQSAALQAL